MVRAPARCSCTPWYFQVEGGQGGRDSMECTFCLRKGCHSEVDCMVLLTQALLLQVRWRAGQRSAGRNMGASCPHLPIQCTDTCYKVTCMMPASPCRLLHSSLPPACPNPRHHTLLSHLPTPTHTLAHTHPKCRMPASSSCQPSTSCMHTMSGRHSPTSRSTPGRRDVRCRHQRGVWRYRSEA